MHRNECLTLKAITQDGNEVYFKCKVSTPLQKLMHAFCNRQGVSMNSVRFLFDGNRIDETQTPQQLDMEDGESAPPCATHAMRTRALSVSFKKQYLTLGSGKTCFLVQ